MRKRLARWLHRLADRLAARERLAVRERPGELGQALADRAAVGQALRQPDFPPTLERVPAIPAEKLAAFWRQALVYVDFDELLYARGSRNTPLLLRPFADIATAGALSDGDVAQGEAKPAGEKAVHVILALWEDVDGQARTKGRFHPLLALPAVMTEAKTFAPALRETPTLNERYLAPDVKDRCFTLATSDDAHNALATVFDDLAANPGLVIGWQDWWEAGAKVIANLAKTDIDGLAEELARRVRQEAEPGSKRETSWGLYGAAFESKGGAGQSIAPLYDSIAIELATKQPTTALFRRLAGGAAPEPSAALDQACHPIRGHIDEYHPSGRALFPLDPTQRRAVRAILSLRPSEIQAINGPPGSGKTSMLRAVVASRWVSAALAHGPCPITLACGATNQAAQNVISAFAAGPSPGGAPSMTTRWIADAAGYGAVLSAQAQSGSSGRAVMLADVWQGSFLWRCQDQPNFLDPERVLEDENAYLMQARRVLSPARINSLEDAVQCLRLALSGLDERRKRLVESSLPLSRGPMAEWHRFVDSLRPQWSDSRAQRVEELLGQLAAAHGGEPGLHDLIELTVAPQAFHVAARYWEGRFLLAQRERLLSRHEQNVEESLRRLCMLMPCLVSTLHSARRWTKLDPRTLAQNDQRGYLGGKIDLLVVDEAGQASPEIAGAVFGMAQRAAVVGDMKQLAPIWNHTALAERALARQTGTAALLPLIQHTRRSVASGSLLGAARLVSRWHDENEEGIGLRFHYRCKPSIIGYCNQLAYGGQLAPRTNEDDGFPEPAMAWVGVDAEPRRVGGSYANEAEAEEIASWIVERWPAWSAHPALQGQTLEKIVALLTAYRPQAGLLKKRLEAAFDRARQAPGTWPSAAEVAKVTIGTVHRLQGDERAIICFSLVEGPDAASRSFIDRDATLMNVAVSRAKQSFIIFGHSARLFAPRAARPARLGPIHALGAYLRKAGKRLYPHRVVLIEAGGKQATLAGVLGKDALVIPTGGALRRLEIQGGVDIEAGCVPRPTLEDGAAEVLRAVRKHLADTQELTLATDDDRMGEFIAWQAKMLLQDDLDGCKMTRVRLGALTPSIIKQAFAVPDRMHEGKVLAEATREVVDTLVTARLCARIADLGDACHRLADKTRKAYIATGACVDDARTLGRSAPVLGRVMAAVLRLILERARKSVETAQLLRIRARVEVGGVALKGTVYKVAEERDTTPISAREDVLKFLAGVRLVPRGLPLHVREADRPPKAGTLSILAEAWSDHGILPWDAMAALQALYDGSWSAHPTDLNDPIDPIDIGVVAAGHPPIQPLDRAAPPAQLASVLTATQSALYAIIWRRMLANEDASYWAGYIRYECGLSNAPDGPLAVRFEERGNAFDPPKRQAVFHALFERWADIADAPVSFTAEPASPWNLGMDDLLARMARMRLGRPSTVAGVLKRLVKHALIEVPRERGPVRLTPAGLALALALEEQEPELSDPRFSSDLSRRLDAIETGAATPREVLGDLLPRLSPAHDRARITPRIWSTLAELEAAMRPRPKHPGPGSLIGATESDADAQPPLAGAHPQDPS